MNIYTNFCYPTEVCDVAKLFFSDSVLADKPHSGIDLYEHVDGTLHTFIGTFFGKVEMQKVDLSGIDELHAIRLRKRFAKITTYNLLVKVTGKNMPWGSLTGIRPTKLARQLKSEGLDWKQQFVDVLGVSEQKTQLVDEILTVQGNLYNK